MSYAKSQPLQNKAGSQLTVSSGALQWLLGITFILLSANLLAATTISSILPNRIAIQTGKSVSVTVIGTDLNTMSRALVFENRRPSRNVTARFVGKPTNTRINLVISARTSARTGNFYEIVMIGSGNKPVRVPSNILSLAVVRAQQTPQPSRTAPALRPSSNTPVASAGGTRIDKPRPGQGIRNVAGVDGKDISTIRDIGKKDMDRFNDLNASNIRTPDISNPANAGHGATSAPGTSVATLIDAGAGKIALPDPTSNLGINPEENKASNDPTGQTDQQNKGPSIGTDYGNNRGPINGAPTASGDGRVVTVGGQLMSQEEAAASRLGSKTGQLSDDDGTDDASAPVAVPDSDYSSDESLTDTVVKAVKNFIINTNENLNYYLAGPPDPLNGERVPAEQKYRSVIKGTENSVEHRYRPNPMDDSGGRSTPTTSNGTTRGDLDCVNKECTEEGILGRPAANEAQLTNAAQRRINSLINPGDGGGGTSTPGGPGSLPTGCEADGCGEDPTINSDTRQPR